MLLAGIEDGADGDCGAAENGTSASLAGWTTVIERGADIVLAVVRHRYGWDCR